MGLGDYQNSHELQLVNSAAICYANGDIEGAIGYLRAEGKLLGVALPAQPLPSTNITANIKLLRAYYFQALEVLCGGKSVKINKIRATYANPITVEAVKS